MQLDAPLDQERQRALVAELAVVVRDALYVADVVLALGQQFLEALDQRADQPAIAIRCVRADDAHFARLERDVFVAPLPGDQGDGRDGFPGGGILDEQPMLGTGVRVVQNQRARHGVDAGFAVDGEIEGRKALDFVGRADGFQDQIVTQVAGVRHGGT